MADRRMADELLHFSSKPLTHVRDVAQEARDGRSDKPNGLWLSVGTAWPEWCLGESFACDRLSVITRVVLAEDARILWLASSGVLDEFTKCYSLDPARHAAFYRDRDSIDWSRVADHYDGIVIAPYIYERRHSLPWYYGWDVASGCVWRGRAVASLESFALDLAALAAVEDV